MTTTEIFKDIDNSTTRIYSKVQISNFGNVKIIYKNSTISDKIHCGTNHSAGYKQIGINNNKYYIHRLVGQYFVENLNPELYNQIDHIDRNPKNNHFTNLHWVDCSTNLKNRSPFTSKNKKGKIRIHNGAKKPFHLRYIINKKRYNKPFKTEREALLAQKYYIALLPLLEFEFKL